MFKILVGASFILASFGLRMQPNHEQTWAPVTTLTDQQKKWDEFFRSKITAIGQSPAKQSSTNSNGSLSLRYIDASSTTATTAWQVTGNTDANNKAIDKVLQVKTETDAKNPLISTITKTTVQNRNIQTVNKGLFA